MRFVHKNINPLGIGSSETPIPPPPSDHRMLESSDEEDNASLFVYFKKHAAQRNGKEKVGTSRANNTFNRARKRDIHKLVITMSCPRRTRVYWTPEEEDMLKVGVQQYSGTSRKYIPWKKILKFGYGVFDVGRSPEDLKDKWRHMMVKEVSKKETINE